MNVFKSLTQVTTHRRLLKQMFAWLFLSLPGICCTQRLAGLQQR